ncbi:heme-binding protein 2-like protein [Cinnamomum micranthum f. kanehirae]|uniref:Heme-binding protein 2-like protein n=1 Tax=Cinnamomum micranthum f. kanehirae TaxID=337451 RepID=A0A3S3QL92_9MAGN|nr:heme-binding protein 2-like protein [Cinnamomum micranthum f. kanehirae]
MGLLARGFFNLLLLVTALSKGQSLGYEKSPNCGSLECPSYEILHSQEAFEIRSYKDAVWMSTPPINSSSYKEAANTGFDMLFAYIQGKNHQGTKIEMTAPVLIDISPSTGPFCNSSFIVYFYMPRKYQKEPPLSDQVHQERWPQHRYAAIRRFGGFMNDSNIPMEASALKKSLKGTAWESKVASRRSTYTVAGYNSPLEYENRINEVMLLFDEQ